MKKMKYILLITMLSAGFCFTAKAQEKGNLCFNKSCKGKEALQNRKRQSQPSCYKWLQ